ncbi:MAG TPA: hypothetical protein VH196_05120 [Terriglobales bacterium]|jgi:hypothetical protein|nr:hypothetical protein [Terriglobales bacterium]
MSIIAQPRSRIATSLRIAIWSAFLIVIVAPLLLERTGQPFYGALLLRPGIWILAKLSPTHATDRTIVLLNLFFYLIVIYAVLSIFGAKGINYRGHKGAQR